MSKQSRQTKKKKTTPTRTRTIHQCDVTVQQMLDQQILKTLSEISIINRSAVESYVHGTVLAITPEDDVVSEMVYECFLTSIVSHPDIRTLTQDQQETFMALVFEWDGLLSDLIAVCRRI